MHLKLQVCGWNAEKDDNIDFKQNRKIHYDCSYLHHKEF